MPHSEKQLINEIMHTVTFYIHKTVLGGDYQLMRILILYHGIRGFIVSRTLDALIPAVAASIYPTLATAVAFQA